MTMFRLAAATVLVGAACFHGLPDWAMAALPAHRPVAAAAILVAAGEGYALLGLQLGMSPDAVIGVAKAAGWKYQVRQGSLPGSTAYVDQVTLEAPFLTTVEFSAVTGNAVRIDARGRTVVALWERDELFQAAVAKWGEPLPHRGDGLPKYLVWADRDGFHPTYRLSDRSVQEPAHVSMADEPARAASAASLAGPPKPKSSL